MSEDSFWGEDINPLSLNRYTYAHNNPIMFVDPTGHLAIVATDDEGNDVTTVDNEHYTYQDITVDQDNVDVIQNQMDANEEDNALIDPYDKNQMKIDTNTDVESVSLFAEDGSDNLLVDGSDSGKGTYQHINDLSWNYNNYYQELKDLNNSGIDKNCKEYKDKFNSITQNMVDVKNQAIDARNNYANGNTDSQYGKYISGASNANTNGDTGNSTAVSNTTEVTDKTEINVIKLNNDNMSKYGKTDSNVTVTQSIFGTNTVPQWRDDLTEQGAEDISKVFDVAMLVTGAYDLANLAVTTASKLILKQVAEKGAEIES